MQATAATNLRRLIPCSSPQNTFHKLMEAGLGLGFCRKAVRCLPEPPRAAPCTSRSSSEPDRCECPFQRIAVPSHACKAKTGLFPAPSKHSMQTHNKSPFQKQAQFSFLRPLRRPSFSGSRQYLVKINIVDHTNQQFHPECPRGLLPLEREATHRRLCAVLAWWGPAATWEGTVKCGGRTPEM